jgi:hypothetical protein
MVASKIPSSRIVVSSTVTLRRLNLSVTATTNPNSRHRSQERCSDKESGHLSVDSVIIYLECKSSSFLIRRPSRTQWCLRKRTLKFLTSSIVRAKTFFTLKFLLITTSSRIWHLSEIKQATLPSYSPHNHSFALLSVKDSWPIGKYKASKLEHISWYSYCPILFLPRTIYIMMNLRIVSSVILYSLCWDNCYFCYIFGKGNGGLVYMLKYRATTSKNL